MTRARWGALAMAALLALYLVIVMSYAVRLIAESLPVAQGIGWALIFLPLLGFWALVVEVRFGFRAEALAREYEALGDHHDDPVPARPSGRLERAAAEAAFERYATEVRDNPHSWPQWFRLALSYDAARDRRRARWAMRHAIRLQRSPAEVRPNP